MEHAVPPSHLADETGVGLSYMQNKGEGELWAEPVAPPSYLADETDVRLSYLKNKGNAEDDSEGGYMADEESSNSVVLPATKVSWIAPATPLQLSVAEDMKALTFSPIEKVQQELAWDPE